MSKTATNRFVGITELRFVAYDGTEFPIGGVKLVRNYGDESGPQECHVTALDIRSLQAIPVGVSGFLRGFLRDWLNGAEFGVPVEFGPFRNDKSLLVEGGHREIDSAILRLRIL